MPPKQDEVAQPVPAPAAAAPTVRRLKYRRPWLVYLPTVIAFMLLNYLVISTETDDTGKYRILPDYVHELAEDRDNALRDHEEPAFNAFLYFEDEVMGFLFRLGTRLFGGMHGVTLVLVGAWLIHVFELGMCVRICISCHASAIVTLRYCFCTITAGFAQLMPLMTERNAYVQAERAEKAAGTVETKKNEGGEAGKKKNI